MPLVVLASLMLPLFCITSRRVWRLILFAIISVLAISREKISTSCPACAIWSAICVTRVVLPREEIAPTTYKPSYNPPSRILSRPLTPVGIKGVSTLAAMPLRKAWRCAAVLVWRYFSRSAARASSSIRSPLSMAEVNASRSAIKASFASLLPL